MLGKVKTAAERLGSQVEEGKVTQADGKEEDILILEPERTPVVVLDRGEYVILLVVLDIPPEDGERLAKQPEDLQRRLFTILKMEMMEGRSGYVLDFTEDEPKRLRQIRISQKVIVRDQRPETLQRLADGLQELVVVAARSREVLSQAFTDVRATQTTETTFHQGMYR